MRHPPPYNLLLVSPYGLAPAGALGGAAEMVHSGLARLGLPARIVVNEYLRDATNIVFAVHNLDPSLVGALPPGTIVYNTEMVVERSHFVDAMLPFVRAFETWDYSAANVRGWNALGAGERVRLVRPAYLPEFTTVAPDAPRDVDVLFYGWPSPRRDRAIGALREAGLDVRAMTAIFGEELRSWIARSRILLNVHHREGAVFEFARMSTALANRRCFVSESGGEEDVDPSLLPGFVRGTIEELPALCRGLVDDGPRRESIALAGFERYSATDFSRELADALGIEPPRR
ncbi:hypothetical protein BURK1_01120 [Burkholderiales bacterium]|nr:hypothetical protein BURK1_01120 [Burkholderiales bacterium]